MAITGTLDEEAGEEDDEAAPAVDDDEGGGGRSGAAVLCDEERPQPLRVARIEDLGVAPLDLLSLAANKEIGEDNTTI